MVPLLTCLVWSWTVGCSENPAALDSGDDGSLFDGGADTSYPNQPGGNPIVPEVAAYPFPSDFFLVEDPTTRTGRRMVIPDDVLPELFDPSGLEGMDGFTRIPLILTYLPGGIDPLSLPPADDPAITITDASPVLVVEEDSWEMVPILVERDLNADSDLERALIIRPLRTLKPSTGYVVILRDTLRAADGTPHRAIAAFKALRDGVPTTDPAIERQRPAFQMVRSALDGLQLDAEEVIQAWVFHTRSAEPVTDPLLAMQEAANTAPLAGYTIVSDIVESSDERENRKIEATFTVPSFIGPDGRIQLDTAGEPVQQGEQEVTFGLTIPLTVDEPRPVIVFGHGFLNAWQESTRGSFNDLCARFRFSAVATNIGFFEGIQPIMFKSLSGDSSQWQVVVAETLQTFVNVTALARLVKEHLSDEIVMDTPGGPQKVLDAKQVHYMGISNGGTFGYVVAATSPQFSRAALVVGGGGLVHFLERAEPWLQYIPFISLAYPDPLQRQLVMALSQHIVDPIDSMNYAEHLVHDRYSGLGPLKVSVHMAVHDSQVRNLVTEWVVRTAGIPLVTPSPRQIFALDRISAEPPDGASADASGALIVYDENVEPPPVGNLPPPKDNGAHSSVRKLDAYQRNIASFIAEGKLVQHCDGACDPE